jgi:hypothetical protein
LDVGLSLTQFLPLLVELEQMIIVSVLV